MNRKFILLIVSIFLYSLTSNAKEQFNFKHIKLGSLLKERADIIRNSDDFNDISVLSTKSTRLSPGQRVLDENDKYLARALKLEISEDDDVGVSKMARVAKAAQVDKAFVDEQKKSLIYKAILSYLGDRFREIGAGEAQNIIDHSQDFDLGSTNFSGFDWQKPMGSYGISVNRKITPDYKNANRWIVLDSFEISINAQTFLEKIMDAGLASLEGIGLDAFAGLTFKRRYTFYHFANSYIDGLKSDYSRLFLPFLQFSRKKLLNMPAYHFLKKEDYLSVNAGASVETPPVYGFDLKGGVMVELSRAASVSAQSLGPQDDPTPGEILRVAIDKQFKLKTGISVDLQLDFFKLLKLTLLSYELEYSIAKQDTINLSFSEEDKKKLLGQSETAKELDRLLRLFNLKVRHLEPNIISSEQSKKNDLNSHYSAFIFGKLKNSKTESVKIIKDGKVKELYRHTSENVAVEKSIWSRLWATIVYKIFEIESKVKNVAYKAKKFVMEYDSDRRQNTTVYDEEKFSIELSQKVEVNKTKGWSRKRFRRLMAKSLLGLSNINREVADKVMNQELVGPMVLNHNIQIQKDAMRSLHSKDENLVFENLAKTCRSRRVSKWKNAKKRSRFLRRIQVGKELCVKKLGKSYLSYMNEVRNYGQMNLDKLKKFLTYYLKKSKTYENLVDLFGHDRLFVHGRFAAYTNSGESFVTYFHQGVFSGLGLIESHKRSTSMVPIVYNK
jgi:hypothetical protein